jgi:hypothetical protein
MTSMPNFEAIPNDFFNVESLLPASSCGRSSAPPPSFGLEVVRGDGSRGSQWQSAVEGRAVQAPPHRQSAVTVHGTLS